MATPLLGAGVQCGSVWDAVRLNLAAAKTAPSLRLPDRNGRHCLSTMVAMGLSETEKQLVEAVTDLSERRGHIYEVAAGVQTADGRIYLGVNLFHFSGGPCAEIVALGCAITDTDSPPVSVVAVRNNNIGIISPCGVCRQIMYDRWRDIGIILKRRGEPVRVGLAGLLPEP